MHFQIKVFLITLSFLGLSACASSLAVQSDFDTQYDLSSYKTFSVISPSLENQENEISINPILIQRIARSIESTLINKGLSGDYNPTIAKVLLTKHGYREGIDATTNNKDVGTVLLNPVTQALAQEYESKLKENL